MCKNSNNLSIPEIAEVLKPVYCELLGLPGLLSGAANTCELLVKHAAGVLTYSGGWSVRSVDPGRLIDVTEIHAKIP